MLLVVRGVDRDARLLVYGPVVNGAALTEFNGRRQVSDGLITTAIVITRDRMGDLSVCQDVFSDVILRLA